MAKRETPTGKDLTMGLTRAAAQGAPIPKTPGHKTAHILTLTIMAGGAEHIDPQSLISGETPRALPRKLELQSKFDI